LNDKATSTDPGGAAESTYLPEGLTVNPAGSGRTNNGIFSYNEAVKIITDEMTTNANILAIPGIRDTFVTDNAAKLVKDNSMMFYAMDLIPVDDTGTRVFDDSASRPDVRKTIDNFVSRQVDNNYVASYFPDIRIDDTTNNRRVKVPASVAALAALSYNDNVAYPWFAPAGFNRGALEFVKGLDVRLDSEDRNLLQEARINPIANFPREGIAIFGQKTLQFTKSALDRVNVRRLMIEVKRQVLDVARRIVFEQNNSVTRGKFVSQITPLLGLIQAQAGIEGFKVICDETNNTQADVDANKLNGKIIVIPVRAVEFIAIDFIITPSGVEFTA
jgi:phage tail sheath protein FI